MPGSSPRDKGSIRPQIEAIRFVGQVVDHPLPKPGILAATGRWHGWMKLPNGRRAIIDRRKLEDYCLSPTHPVGRNKARVFKQAVGLDQTNATVLLRALRSAAMRSDAKHGTVDHYGQRYTVDFEFQGPTGSATIRSAWVIRTGEDAPRLTTCYVLRGGLEATSP